MKKLLPQFCFLFLALSVFYSCQPSPEELKQLELDKYKVFDAPRMQTLIENEVLNDAVFGSAFPNADQATLQDQIKRFYKEQGNKLVWQELTTGEINGKTELLIQALVASKDHALDPATMAYQEIRKGFQDGPADTTSVESKVKHRTKQDVLLTGAVLTYAQQMHRGTTKPEGTRRTPWEIVPEEMDYTAGLMTALANNTLTEYFQSLRPSFSGYEDLVAQYAKFSNSAENLSPVAIPTNYKFSKGKKGAEVKVLIDRLKFSGELAKSFSGETFNDDVIAAVKKFQANNGITNNGNVGKQTLGALNEDFETIRKRIALNLERMRWLPSDLGEEYVMVNVPDCTLDYYQDGKSVMDMIVVVGDPKSSTPIFSEDMTHLVLSPVWNVPVSIAREEILQYVHINPNLLIVAGVDVFHKGKKLKDPLSVEWTPETVNSRDYTFRVRPSANNALGNVKFMFPNRHSVYLHDTNSKDAFQESNRAQSAGCIRVFRPVDLAEKLLAGKEGWGRTRIKANMGRGSERRVNLTRNVPVYMYYLTAWVEDGVLQSRKDIYGLDALQSKKLN